MHGCVLIIIWADVEVGGKVADSVAARIEGLTIEGDIDTDSDGTQTSALPVDNVEVDMHKPLKHRKHHRRDRNKGFKSLVNRSFYWPLSTSIKDYLSPSVFDFDFDFGNPVLFIPIWYYHHSISIM